MAYPRYSFQHSILFIDRPEKYEELVASGLLSFPVHFEFCPNNLASAVSSIEQTKPDLIIASLEFQDTTILEFIEKVKANLGRIPLIYISEPHLSDVQKQILKTGAAFDFAQRSNQPDDLICKMDHAVRVTREFKRSRGEAFIALHDESIEKGIPVSELLLQVGEDPLH